MQRLAFVVLYLAVYASATGWIVYRTFTNIDVTRTRLFVTFWLEWIIIAVVLVLMEYLRATWFRRITRQKRNSPWDGRLP